MAKSVGNAIKISFGKRRTGKACKRRKAKGKPVSKYRGQGR